MECDAKLVDLRNKSLKCCSFPHRQSVKVSKVTKVWSVRSFENEHKRVPSFNTLSKRVELQSATWSVDVKTTCTSLETFEKERFCSFPYRHGEPQENQRLETSTRVEIKTSISCESSSKFDTLNLQNRRFPEFSHEPSNLLPQNRCFVRGFRQFSAHLQNATPARGNLHRALHLTQPCQCDLQKTRNTTRLKCCACHEK